MKDITQYALVEPDIATIKYVNDGKIYTVYYDFNSTKYSKDTDAKDAVQWSQYEIGDKAPKPDSKRTEVSIDDDDMFMFKAYGMSLDSFDSYVDACKKMGYTLDPSSYEGYYSADSSDGYGVHLNYSESDGSISGTVKVSDNQQQDTGSITTSIPK